MKSANKIKRCDYISLTEIRAKFHGLNFYIKAQNAFIKMGKKNKKKYFILDNSNDSTEVESKILNIVTKKLK